jgi:hypothetical protein
MSRETLVEEHYMLASTEAALFVEEHARLILQRHPCLHEFVMAMGTWFFTKKKSHSRSLVPGEHEMVHPTDYDAPKYIAKGKLARFINEWDEYLKITGEPMRFTADGPVVREW